jgi:hypothetical protein
MLNREIFRNGREAQIIVENWRQEYNNYRPHSSLGYSTPAEVLNSIRAEASNESMVESRLPNSDDGRTRP